ncbi:MAG: glutamate synthase subunit beta [Methylocystis sp.]|nr:glutamate synthase subunit beta [Methylocystis sp.]MCA3582913.1 glutamate synthase subunit beta [Methylocystis sp.]MCA3589516.1 glutamate synthase subunit beta [Methylocystis sp.]MCA3590318.1 glutamate synthase subunit beta [Methylocystis sp.]
MGKVTGFLEIDRQDRKYAPASDRIRHYKEFVLPLSDATVKDQASRCMNCGIPFCHNGCPVNNQIPDWNDLVYQDDWEEALNNLHSTNNFPEFTGRVCPAPCEASCTLNIEDTPVTIKSIECAIIDKGWEMGWVKPEPPKVKTGRSVAIVGSGPAGLAAAQQLARAGHDVHLYEKAARAGGLLRYGIPDFKMEKKQVDRRVEQMEAEGVTFHYNVNVGVDLSARELADRHDALILTGGAEKPRDLPIPGRHFRGIHFAMDFLPQQNRRVSNEGVTADPILATGKHVVVIGGGDTGSDCIGTSVRQGALSVTQLEIMPQPPEKENKALTWPNWPLKLRTSSSHQEGAERQFAVATVRFEDDSKGNVKKLVCAQSGHDFKPVPGTEFELKADLVLLAMGFVQPVHEGMVQELAVATDGRGNVKATDRDYRTSLEKVFVAGDMRRGQSLVVWAIREGRQAARAVDEYLMGESVLPR